jgi:uncharacterized membrane protein
MTLIGRLHPLIVHFPIALVIIAAFAESGAWVTRQRHWRIVAFTNVRVAAVFAIAAAFAGWRLAGASFDSTAVVEWHRWLGVCAAASTVAAALATVNDDEQSLAPAGVFRAALISATVLVIVTAHLGGVLVWGADFLQP